MTVRILQGDCRDVLKTLPDESVHCVVTSPPYWGLRDYGVAGQLGLESTPQEYVERMVAVFEEVRRVLRDDGTLWCNLGDSYTSGGRKERDPGQSKIHPAYDGDAFVDGLRPGTPPGLKPKDLVGIPWRVAFALQADGWYLRQDIIWSKPNPMPESVTDRCTKAHEYIFLLAKGQWVSRVVQFTDIEGERFHLGQYIGSQKPAVREPITTFCIALASTIFDNTQAQHNFSLPPFYAEEWKKCPDGSDSQFVRHHPTVGRLAGLSARFLSAQATTKEFMQEFDGLRLDLGDGDKFLIGRGEPEGALAPAVDCNSDGAVTVHDSGQICEFKFRHGQAIIRRPSGCSYYFDADAITTEAAPSSIERLSQPTLSEQEGSARVPGKTNGNMKAVFGGRKKHAGYGTRIHSGNEDQGNYVKNGVNKRSVWTVTTQPFKEAHFATFPPALIEPCILAGCPEGGTVLDPFGGAGTTGMVADRHHRDAILIELNASYCEMARKRILSDGPLFADVR